MRGNNLITAIVGCKPYESLEVKLLFPAEQSLKSS